MKENPRPGEIVIDRSDGSELGASIRYESGATNVTIRDVYAIPSDSHFVLISSRSYDYGRGGFPQGVFGVAHTEEEADKRLYDYIRWQTEEVMKKHYSGHNLVDKVHPED